MEPPRYEPTALGDLVAQVPDARLVQGDPATPIGGVTHDSRAVRPGDLFVAVPGLRLDGSQFIHDAIIRGASAVAAESPATLSGGLPVVAVRSARAALADLAAAFYGHPSEEISVVGVTGTDGKTSTTYLLSAILEAHGLRTGWLTTVNTKIGDTLHANEADHTTPEAPIVQRTLREMADAGVDVAIIETSSHALALDRVRGTRYRVGIFTNLSPEHLNFHGTFEEYRAAKARLFAMLPAHGLAVLNGDDPSSQAMREATQARVLTFGHHDGADIWAEHMHLDPRGTTFLVHVCHADGWESLEVTTTLVGRFNVSNWLAAFGADTYFGASLDDLEQAAKRQHPVPGRMNLVHGGQPFTVVVDFAHTPQALEKALHTLRELTDGRVLLVFGLAGGRDFHNRPVMGALAARESDFFVVSADDPGEEDSGEIARQIADGARSEGATEGQRFTIDVDRRSAIRSVLAQARPGDVVLLAGKGHEQRMVLATGKVPWNDQVVAEEEVAALGYGR